MVVVLRVQTPFEKVSEAQCEPCTRILQYFTSKSQMSRHQRPSHSPEISHDLPQWRATLAAFLERTPEPRPGYFWAQVSTIRSASRRTILAGRPAIRTVGLRFLTAAAARSPAIPDTELIKFMTDRRSDKVDELHHSPACEILLFFPEIKAQVRLSGTIDVYASGHATSVGLWRGLDDFERRFYAWPAPGAPRAFAPGDSADRAVFDVPVPSAEESPPDCFTVCALRVDYVECLDKGVYPPIRDIEVKSSGAWSVAHINP